MKICLNGIPYLNSALLKIIYQITILKLRSWADKYKLIYEFKTGK